MPGENPQMSISGWIIAAVYKLLPEERNTRGRVRAFLYVRARRKAPMSGEGGNGPAGGEKVEGKSPNLFF